jgi:hypothetical protein
MGSLSYLLQAVPLRFQLVSLLFAPDCGVLVAAITLLVVLHRLDLMYQQPEVGVVNTMVQVVLQALALAVI